MTSYKTEQEFWEKYKGIQLKLCKEKFGRAFYYNGKIVSVFEKKLIFNDCKLGDIPLEFDSLSIIGTVPK